MIQGPNISNGETYFFWHCCGDPFTVFFSEVFTYATATNAQFTYAATARYAQDGNNDKLPMESTFLLK